MTSSSNMDTSSIDFPDEIIELILSRCPIKSVVRFKSVSKSWQSIISDPRFSRIHRIQRSKMPENQNKFLVLNQAGECIYLIRLEDGKLRTESALDCPFQTKLGKLRLLSSCNGLFLVGGDNNKHDFALWNPSIRKHIIIRALTPRPWHCDIYHDSVTDDHKIVFVYENCYTVYSCKNGSWAEMRDIPHDLIRLTVCIDGCFYGEECNGEIVCFDTRDGKLHKFRLPNDVRGGYVLLDKVSGRVCLSEFFRHWREKIQLWVMEKHGSFDKWCFSWRKLISIEEEDRIIYFHDPLCLSNEDHVVLKVFINSGGELGYGIRRCIYNPHQNSFNNIGFDRELEDGFLPFSENLYMPSSNVF